MRGREWIKEKWEWRGERPGAVLLWENGRVLPELIGRLVNSSFKMECSLPVENLPKSLIVGNIEDLSFDLTTCYHEAPSGLYEEFFLTTVYFKDILRPRDL